MSFFSKIKDFLFLSREDRLFKAINKGDEESVASLIRKKDYESKKYDFLNLAVVWGNEKIVDLVLSKGGFDINDVNKHTGDSALHLAVNGKNNKLVKFFLEKKIDINIVNSQGISAIQQSIQEGNDEISATIINSKNFDSLSLEKKNGLFYECAVKSRFNTSKLLLEKGCKLDDKTRGDLTFRELFALNDNSKDFLRDTGNFSSDKDLDNFIAASKAKAILNLSYAEEGISMRSSIVNNLIRSSIIDENFEKKNEILQTLDVIGDNKKKIKLANGNNLSVREVSYEDHAAYFIFEHDKNDKPIKVTYCDGNSIEKADKNGYINGAISFDIDQKKVAKFKDFDVFQDYLVDAFSVNSKEMYKNDGKNFYDAISKIAVCDENNNPIIDKQIPIKEQKRGNCTLKSCDIVIREVLRRTDQEMVFENINGKQSGKGYEVYKNYKNFLIEEPINKLINLADKSNEKDFGYKERLDILENTILPKAQKKGNDGLISKIKNLFDKIRNPVADEKSKTVETEKAVEGDVKDISNSNKELKKDITEKITKNNAKEIESPTNSPEPKEALQLVNKDINKYNDFVMGQ